MPKWFQFCIVEAMAVKSWYIGCSGFHYKEWKNEFYPPDLPQRKWFSYYASHFNTLELNVTFYKFPQVSYLKNWFENSPEEFIFSVKVPRLITHYKQFNDVGRMLGDFYSSCREGLCEKLGPVLFQLPPRLIYTEERLDKIISAASTEFVNVIEFRHPSWWTKKVYLRMAKHNLVFCGSSFPDLPDEPIINGTTAYYRFHGVPLLFKSAYPESKLISTMQCFSRKRKPNRVFIYFNNTATQAAIENAGFLTNLLKSEEKISLSVEAKI
jgi:uncharacterized protein YecE (DUF72 family)